MTYSCQQYSMTPTVIRKPLHFQSFATKNLFLNASILSIILQAVLLIKDILTLLGASINMQNYLFSLSMILTVLFQIVVYAQNMCNMTCMYRRMCVCELLRKYIINISILFNVAGTKSTFY